MLSIEDSWFAVIRSWAASKPDIAKAFVFGSRAKGIARPDSDLDIGIIVASSNPNEDDYTCWFFNRDDWNRELAEMIPITIDLQIANESISTTVVAPAVKDHGVLIFDRSAIYT
ncbi:MAG TPA: nucleotidyltransferase domain-containing protein [Hyphomonadaceae bacterium]|nr:nucleotidyltransferase domain-containing protein [Hyphomonadaceae bacterium]